MHGELWKIRPDGSHKVLVDNYQGKLLNGPNDVWINPTNGGIYITDPIFPRGYWDAGDPRQQPWEPTRSEQSPQGKGGHVYYLPRGARKLVRVTSDALGWESDSWPNGVVGTPDGKKLYVNKWYYDNKGGTWVFDIKRDGTLTNMRKFSDWGGDGMSMDELGNVYISNGDGRDGVRSQRQQHPENFLHRWRHQQHLCRAEWQDAVHHRSRGSRDRNQDECARCRGFLHRFSTSALMIS